MNLPEELLKLPPRFSIGAVWLEVVHEGHKDYRPWCIGKIKSKKNKYVKKSNSLKYLIQIKKKKLFIP